MTRRTERLSMIDRLLLALSLAAGLVLALAWLGFSFLMSINGAGLAFIGSLDRTEFATYALFVLAAFLPSWLGYYLCRREHPYWG